MLENSMVGGFWHRGRLIGVLAWALFVLAAGSAPVRADTVTVNVDQAHVMRLPGKIATIVIGNPLIADISLQSGGVLVVTGKSFGSTNMLALDSHGKVVMSTTVQVLGPPGNDIVVVYKGIERESYSCAPDCERRLTLGDSPAYFGATLGQIGSRTSAAQAGGPQPAR